MGCYYHGCARCFPDDNVVLANGKTAGELRENTANRLDEIRQFVPVEVIYECDFDSRYSHLNVPNPQYMSLRNVLKGGRTEVFQYYVEKLNNTEIIYVDFVSKFTIYLCKRIFRCLCILML